MSGRHVGVLLENVPEFVFLLGAAALDGTVVVGINPTRRGEELARDIRHTACDLVLTDATMAPLRAAPKAAKMTQGRAARTAAAGAAGFGPSDVLYCSMPLFHGNALLANLFPAVVSGASVVLRRRFSASEFLHDVRRHRCTYFNYVAGPCPSCWPSRRPRTTPTTRSCGASAPRPRPRTGPPFAAASAATSWRPTAPARAGS